MGEAFAPQSPMTPIRALAANPRFLTDASGKAIQLVGSHTWTSLQDTDTSAAPAPSDFNAYCNFLINHGHNCSILWKKDLPTYFNWGAGGTWRLAPHPWPRIGAANATDGLPKFDLSQFYQPFFDRLRARVAQLNSYRIYAIVQLFDGLQLSNNRGAGDGFPFTGANNVNGVDDGYTSGTTGTASITMSATNAITVVQDAFVRKVIDTVNDFPNVIWEVSEEAPTGSSWWQGHMIDLVHTYEAGKPTQHPVLLPTLGWGVSGHDQTDLYNSNADIVAPFVKVSPTSATGTGTPATKVGINDSDHSYFSMWNDSQLVNRNSWAWPNFCNGVGVLFMDPYLINWSGRNAPTNVANGVGTGPDPRWDNLRDNMGQMVKYSRRMNLGAMTPQPALASSGFCLANTGSGAEYVVYSPSASDSGFTVDLSASTHTFNLEWFNPTTLAITSGGTVLGGAVRTLTAPFSNDAVAYLKDSGS